MKRKRGDVVPSSSSAPSSSKSPSSKKRKISPSQGHLSTDPVVVVDDSSDDEDMSFFPDDSDDDVDLGSVTSSVPPPPAASLFTWKDTADVDPTVLLRSIFRILDARSRFTSSTFPSDRREGKTAVDSELAENAKSSVPRGFRSLIELPACLSPLSPLLGLGPIRDTPNAAVSAAAGAALQLLRERKCVGSTFFPIFNAVLPGTASSEDTPPSSVSSAFEKFPMSLPCASRYLRSPFQRRGDAVICWVTLCRWSSPSGTETPFSFGFLTGQRLGEIPPFRGFWHGHETSIHVACRKIPLYLSTTALGQIQTYHSFLCRFVFGLGEGDSRFRGDFLFAPFLRGGSEQRLDQRVLTELTQLAEGKILSDRQVGSESRLVFHQGKMLRVIKGRFVESTAKYPGKIANTWGEWLVEKSGSGLSKDSVPERIEVLMVAPFPTSVDVTSAANVTKFEKAWNREASNINIPGWRCPSTPLTPSLVKDLAAGFVVGAHVEKCVGAREFSSRFPLRLRRDDLFRLADGLSIPPADRNLHRLGQCVLSLYTVDRLLNLFPSTDSVALIATWAGKLRGFESLAEVFARSDMRQHSFPCLPTFARSWSPPRILRPAHAITCRQAAITFSASLAAVFRIFDWDTVLRYLDDCFAWLAGSPAAFVQALESDGDRTDRLYTRGRLNAVERVLGRQFHNKSLLVLAMSHQGSTRRSLLAMLGGAVWDGILASRELRGLAAPSSGNQVMMEAVTSRKLHIYMVSSDGRRCPLAFEQATRKKNRTPKAVCDLFRRIVGGIYLDSRRDLRLIEKMFLG